MTLLDHDVVDDISTSDTDDEFSHYFCPCRPDISICGTPLEGRIIPGEDEPPDCVVCYAMLDAPCPRCGLEDW
jgi:hypothetical protein